ncbi:hypothetical protein GCM10012275_52750 [Longimycelium tulufanense]|uniref:Major tail protein n=1 Tax=Longimycelium tulufanense TaxID=907463 RepID=A0A8J3CJ90_9PSEU|nr:hypothetical protein [Longimycelium tulufanense]GGM75510.1 hypothetical protein GCM10012275_52750 [Longimycelium tulufanense]
MPNTALSELQTLQNELIRKALQGSVFTAAESATLPSTLTTWNATDLQVELTPLPSGYTDTGHITKDDGLTWARATDIADVTSWGEITPTRRDITSDVTTLQFTAQETKLRTLELYNNVDLSAVTPTANTGEVAFSQASRPSTRYFRVFAINQDGSGTDAIWVGRLLPRAMVSEIADQQWVDGNEMSYQITLTAEVDSTAGYSVRHFFGGPKWKTLLTDMGFPAV